MNFTYNMPVNLLFGRGRIQEIGVQCASLGKKALVVVGKSSARKTGLLDRVAGLLADAGVACAVFDDVEQNPLTTTVYRGAALLAQNNCDVVVGVGGGSVMDAAKAIAFQARNGGDLSDYIFGKKTGTDALPVLLAPTTAGTGSEGNCFAVLTNPETNDKKSLRTPLIFPKVSIIDPELLTTMPKKGLASAGFDALAHSIEAYLSRNAQPMTDLMALDGIRLLGENLLGVYDGTQDMRAWEAVSLASTLGGMVICTAGVGVPHGMEHPASGLYFELVHGQGLAALLPPYLDISWSCAPDKFAQVSRLLGGDGAEDCADAVRRLLDRLNLCVTLSELGVRAQDVDWMTDNCMKVSAPSLLNSPLPMTRELVKQLYQQAL